MYIEKLKYNWLLGGNIRKLIFDDDLKKATFRVTRNV